MQMRHPNVVMDAWPSAKTPCEQILSVVLTYSDRSPLSVLELTALAGANLHFYQMQWPRCSILFDLESAPLDLESEEGLPLKLERLGERLRSPSVARAALVKGAERRRAWAEEDRCRAAWALAVLLHSSDWEELENRDYLVRFLASGLVAPAPWASMSTAAAMLQLVHVSDGCHVHSLLAGVGVAEVLVQLIQHTSAPVQQVALKAIIYAAASAQEGDSLGLSGTSVVPAIISIAQLGCYVNQLAALEAIAALANGSIAIADQFKVVIPDVLEFLVHERDEMKEVAACALWNLMDAGQDAVIKASEHGCIPRLIHLSWHAKSSLRDFLLQCLWIITKWETSRRMALQHGILPLLFQSLQGEDFMRGQVNQRLVLDMLLAYPYDARTAFLQEDPGRRTRAVRHMIWIAQRGAPNPASAKELLKQLFPSLLG